MKTPASQPPLSISDFLGAAFSSPGLAVIVCMLGAVATTLGSPGVPNALAAALFGLIFLSVIATVWGAVPSLVFGGLVLALIQRIPWRRRPGVLVFMIGGVVAAGLYVLTGLGVAGFSQSAAMFFAPWATRDIRLANGSWWVWAVCFWREPARD